MITIAIRDCIDPTPHHPVPVETARGMDTAARATFLLVLFLPFLTLSAAQNVTQSRAGILDVGVIIHLKSLVGKMARTTMLMAMEDFYAAHRNYTTKLVLHIRDSNGDNIQAASQGTYHVLRIVGRH